MQEQIAGREVFFYYDIRLPANEDLFPSGYVEAGGKRVNLRPCGPAQHNNSGDVVDIDRGVAVSLHAVDIGRKGFAVYTAQLAGIYLRSAGVTNPREPSEQTPSTRIVCGSKVV